MANIKERLGLAEVLAGLEGNGSARTRKTQRNAGARGELFGVSFAFLKKLHKRVKVDHELALALWETGILDARREQGGDVPTFEKEWRARFGDPLEKWLRDHGLVGEDELG